MTSLREIELRLGEEAALATFRDGVPRRAEGKIIRRATGEVRFDE
jgi:hypothetical protein